MKPPLLESDFEKALENGISRALLHSRYYQRDWPLERATAEPVNKKKPSKHKPYIDAAQVSGIHRSTYLTRVAAGMAKEEASTKPAAKRGRPKGTHCTDRPYTPEQLALAESNGISRQTLNGRLKRNWDLERAITEPPNEFWVRNHGEKAQVFVSRKQRSPKKKRGQNRYTKDQLRIALSNGIRLWTLQGRLQDGWDIERAITEPTHNTNRRKNYIEGVAYN